jgi:hypothetical protein
MTTSADPPNIVPARRADRIGGIPSAPVPTPLPEPLISMALS